MTFGLVEELNAFSCSGNSSQQVIAATVAKPLTKSVKQLRFLAEIHKERYLISV